MLLNIYDLELSRVGSLQSWISMTWEEKYNDIGSLTLEVVQTTDTVSLIKPWRYVTIDKSDQVMIILSVQIEEGHIKAYGKTAACLLDRRTSRQVVNNQNAETAMLSVINNMTSWPLLVGGDASGITDTYTSQISGGTVLTYITKIAKSTDIGFKVLKIGYKGNLQDENKNDLISSDGSQISIFTLDKELTLVFYKPKLNSDARFALEYGNLSDVSFTISDMKYANVAMVAGQGEGNDRVVVYAGETSKTGTNRVEMYVDARDLSQEDGESLNDYKARLVARGLEKLLETNHIKTVTFSISQDSAALGDIVSVKINDYGYSQQVRVTSRTITSEYNSETITLGVGESIL